MVTRLANARTAVRKPSYDKNLARARRSATESSAPDPRFLFVRSLRAAYLVRAEPPGHPRRQRLLGLVQGRADDPVAASRRRRLDLPGAALGQQLLPHPVGPPLGLADAGEATR